MKNLNYVLIFTLFLLGAAGCEDDEIITDKVTGEGPIVTENLDLSAFSKIENTGVANFYITIGSPQSVVIKAQQNIMDVMTYQVTNETLKVGLEKNTSIENHEEIRFDITIPAISSIKLTGVGDFELSGDDQDALIIDLEGVGNVDAFEMRVGTCTITSSGVGNCEVYVLNELTVTISGVGNIYYKGNPVIISSVTGLGQLVNSN
jgi:hypothetical protein